MHPSDILDAARKHLPGLSRPHRPLALNVEAKFKAEIMRLVGVSEDDARRAVKFYLSGRAYHEACKQGADRIDLMGNPVGERVTYIEAHKAQRHLEFIWQAEQRRRA